MYVNIKSVILSAKFELHDMLRKIDILWLQGDLNDDQKAELYQLAREHADPEMSRNLAAQIEDHEARIRAIEEAMKGGQLPKPDPNPGDDEPNATDEYPAFIQGHVYYKGDKVTCGGKHYICVLNEYTDSTTWSPVDYPVYWQEVI